METKDKFMTRRQKAAEFFFNEDDEPNSFFHKGNLKQKIEEKISSKRCRPVAINNRVKVQLPMLKRCEDKKLVWSSKIDVEIATYEERAEKSRRHRVIVAPIEQKVCEVVWSVLVNERNEWSSAQIVEIK